MANISDIIEEFILKTLGEDSFVDISRNELANFFSCANSQINYVLDTRFTMDRGFTKESHRGGGGYIRISKVRLDDNSVSSLILESVGDELSYKRLKQIVDRLEDDGVLSQKEGSIILAGLSDASLVTPLNLKDKIRANSFKNILISIMANQED